MRPQELRRMGELSVQISAGPKGVNMYSLPKYRHTFPPAQKFSPGCTRCSGGVHRHPQRLVHTGFNLKPFQI